MPNKSQHISSGFFRLITVGCENMWKPGFAGWTDPNSNVPCLKPLFHHIFMRYCNHSPHTHIYIYIYIHIYIYKQSTDFYLSLPPSIAFSKTFMSGIHPCLSLYKTGIAAWSFLLFHRFSGFISPGHPEPSDWHSWRRRGSEASAEGRSRVDPKQCKTNKAILPINRDWIWFNMV